MITYEKSALNHLQILYTEWNEECINFTILYYIIREIHKERFIFDNRVQPTTL